MKSERLSFFVVLGGRVLEIWGYALCSRVTCLTSSYPSPSEKEEKPQACSFLVFGRARYLFHIK
jgi:hypothetical protein